MNRGLAQQRRDGPESGRLDHCAIPLRLHISMAESLVPRLSSRTSNLEAHAQPKMYGQLGGP